MKPLLMTITSALLMTLLALTAAAQTNPQSASEVQTLVLEVQRLRLELLQQKLEFQEWKLAQLNRELRLAQTDQQRLEEEERALQQELLALDQHLAQNPPSGNGRVSEEEAVKTELHQHRWPKLRARQQPVLQLVAELNSQLEREQAAQRQLAEQAKRLKAELRSNAQ